MKFTSKQLSSIATIVSILGMLATFIGDQVASAAEDEHIRDIAREVCGK